MVKLLTLFSPAMCLALTGIFAFGCSNDNSSINLPNAGVKYGYYSSTVLWYNPTISVCWETKEYETEKGWVKDRSASGIIASGSSMERPVPFSNLSLLPKNI